jgi:hypothetical protein
LGCFRGWRPAVKLIYQRFKGIGVQAPTAIPASKSNVNLSIDPTKGDADYSKRANDPDRDKESYEAIFNDGRAEFVTDETDQNGFH